MFTNQTVVRARSRDEAEKPFWISYADLMSALMILFLVVMCVALLAVTRKISDAEKKELERGREINQLLELLVTNVQKCGEGQVTVDLDRRIIDFGPQAQFAFGSNKLDNIQEQYLRDCVPHILETAANEHGRKWIKRIVVEGYTDKVGTYLYNLNLSLERSQRVLCALLGKPTPKGPTLIPEGRALSPEERKQIRDLFLVGGYSFNTAKASPEESRRVELRIEFWALSEVPESKLEDIMAADTDYACRLDPRPASPLNPLRPPNPGPLNPARPPSSAPAINVAPVPNR
jgi:outer membrane protein OmpA-like peptidoglycan-associated protein